MMDIWIRNPTNQPSRNRYLLLSKHSNHFVRGASDIGNKSTVPAPSTAYRRSGSPPPDQRVAKGRSTTDLWWHQAGLAGQHTCSTASRRRGVCTSHGVRVHVRGPPRCGPATQGVQNLGRPQGSRAAMNAGRLLPDKKRLIGKGVECRDSYYWLLAARHARDSRHSQRRLQWHQKSSAGRSNRW